jgi:hypothetical protein
MDNEWTGIMDYKRHSLATSRSQIQWERVFLVFYCKRLFHFIHLSPFIQEVKCSVFSKFGKVHVHRQRAEMFWHKFRNEVILNLPTEMQQINTSSNRNTKSIFPNCKNLSVYSHA